MTILDNCSIHHANTVQELFEDAGIVLIYLPPYSPDLNPIEEVFHSVKSYLKAHEELVDVVRIESLVQSAFNSVDTAMCQAFIHHSGY